MKIVLEAVLGVIALFAALYAVNMNEQYADLVAAQSAGYCNVKMGSSTATLACNRISRIESDL